MNSRLTIGIACGLLVLGILVIGYLFLFFGNPQAQDPGTAATSTNPFGFTTGGNVPVSETRTIRAGNGSVTVPDFTKGKESVLLSESPDDLQYDLTPYPEYDPSAPYPTHAYDVQFNEKDSEFVVTLNEEPLGASRLAAEAFLREILGLTNTQLCTLSILVGVPYSVNATLSAYQNLGLSFCAGSVPLPS